MTLRLDTLHKIANRNYTHIWDCCCDHGLLGAKFLQSHGQAQLHFVDTVPEIMQQLEQQLLRFYPQEQQRYNLYCMDAGQIALANSTEKQLVIIAGVGGDLSAELVANILSNNPRADIDFLLCPVYHNYYLRQQLQQLDFYCLDEVLIEENRRFYEAILISQNADNSPKVSAVGHKLWRVSNGGEQAKAQRYLNKLLAHYQRVAKGKNTQAEMILKAYQQVTIEPDL